MDFDCKRCGKCCKEIGIPWAELDVRLVAAHLNVELNDFLASYGFTVDNRSGNIEPSEFGVTPCPFLKYAKEKAICKIYPVRPWVCKGYPGPDILCRAGHKRG